MRKIKNICFPNWPKSATMEDWATWHKFARKRKLCYWLTVNVPSYFRVKKMQLDDVKYWFMYRFQKRHRYHLVDTKLEPKYYETETRMLHAMFSLLQDHVEIEKAQLHYISMEKGDIRPTKSRAGLMHLDWEIGLTHDEYPRPELEGQPTGQAVAAQKIKDLYVWWTVTRPGRADPWDDKLFDTNSFSKDKNESIWEMMAARTDEQKKEASDAYLKREAINEAYSAEDEKMMLRLVKIRRALWT